MLSAPFITWERQVINGAVFFPGLLNLLKAALREEPCRGGYLLCGPWAPPGLEGRGEGRDGAAEGGDEGLAGALADGGGEEGLETEGGLTGRLMPGLDGVGRDDGVEGRLGRPKSGLEGRLPSGRLMPGRCELPGLLPPGWWGLLTEGREGRLGFPKSGLPWLPPGWLIPGRSGRLWPFPG